LKAETLDAADAYTAALIQADRSGHRAFSTS
jgi:hypothetical protein